ncbi:MAG: cation diffusion facilitator family transporter [Proteobacteria bacterium]|nr:cation diffusion facilitator family transporter [Pseudomonadota bacterium]
MSSSVTVSIFTNTIIAAAKGFGWSVTGSPTLFAETVHSLADVGNQVLLKVGEIRGRAGPDREHPFGHGQDKYFWALVSAVSVFFVGCGINLYHGVHSLLQPAAGEPFTRLVLGLLLFSFALEAWTFRTALKEIGGFRAIRANVHNTTVLAVLLEDAVALLGIVLTLVVAGSGYVLGPHPEFDAIVAIVVALLLGFMAVFLATVNRSVLIDSSDAELDAAAVGWLGGEGVVANVHSLRLDSDRAVVFVTVGGALPADSAAHAATIEARALADLGKTVDGVYWRRARDA